MMARPIVTKSMFALLLFCLLFLASVGTRLWITENMSLDHNVSQIVSNPASTEQALRFCHTVLNAEGRVVAISQHMDISPCLYVECATNRGDYYLLLGRGGEVVVAGCDSLDSVMALAAASGATSVSQQEAEGRARRTVLALQQTPERITSHRISWQKISLWEVQCRCLPRAHAVRTYRIQIAEKTGDLTFFSLRIRPLFLPGGVPARTLK